MWCHAGEEAGKGDVQRMAFAFQVPIRCDVPAVLGTADHLPVLTVNEFLVELCLAFAFPVQLSISIHKFSQFLPSNASPTPLVAMWG